MMYKRTYHFSTREKDQLFDYQQRKACLSTSRSTQHWWLCPQRLWNISPNQQRSLASNLRNHSCQSFQHIMSLHTLLHHYQLPSYWLRRNHLFLGLQFEGLLTNFLHLIHMRLPEVQSDSHKCQNVPPECFDRRRYCSRTSIKQKEKK